MMRSLLHGSMVSSAVPAYDVRTVSAAAGAEDFTAMNLDRICYRACK
jgi:hypothetical protein